MLKTKPQLIFGLVREDPIVELEAAKTCQANTILSICSGGCTALSLKSAIPNAQIDLVDINPTQIDFVKKKVSVLESSTDASIAKEFNIGAHTKTALNSQGVWDKVYSCFRLLTYELIMPYDEFLELFSSGAYNKNTAKVLLQHKLWPIILEMIFNSPLLAVLRENYVKHKLGKFASYMSNKISQQLLSDDALNNYFLHYLFLGHYIAPHLPIYLQEGKPHRFDFKYLNASVVELDNLSNYDLLCLSNICDWMNETQINAFCLHLKKNLHKGAYIVLRQNTGKRPLSDIFKPHFEYHKDFSTNLSRKERSMGCENVFIFSN